MPIYAYRCDACGFEKDVLQKLSDPTLTDCPSCGKSAFGRMLTAPNFQLKGTGWYVTDFRDGNKGKKGTESGDGAAGDGKAAGEAGTSEGASSGTEGSSKPADAGSPAGAAAGAQGASGSGAASGAGSGAGAAPPSGAASKAGPAPGTGSASGSSGAADAISRGGRITIDLRFVRQRTEGAGASR